MFFNIYPIILRLLYILYSLIQRLFLYYNMYYIFLLILFWNTITRRNIEFGKIIILSPQLGIVILDNHDWEYSILYAIYL